MNVVMIGFFSNFIVLFEVFESVYLAFAIPFKY